jgi:16S rRNA (cytosine967-C5)-methyltransferase
VPPGPADLPRLVAYELLRAVSEQAAYANLVLPRMIDERGLEGRDAALATELAYGTLRATGTLDEVISACIDRPLDSVDAPVRDLLRLGAYQALRTRIPAHAAVTTTVDLSRATGHGRASGFVNAVLRKVLVADWEGWTERLARGGGALRRLALETAHPEWIAAAFAAALDGDLAEAQAALTADDLRPQTHLVAWPGLIDRSELLSEVDGEPGPWSPYAVRLNGGDPGDLAAVRAGRAAVQDEGSQLCALALTAAPITGPDERWLDLCAGPGGKTALLAALGASRGAHVNANELHPHRAELVRRSTAAWDVTIEVTDSRWVKPSARGYDRVLLDAPCTGLGALRRRPEARWRRSPDDVTQLGGLQKVLLESALRLVRPGGVVAYVTCSPHLAETAEVVAGYPLVDARPLFAGLPLLGDGPTVQLWPHRHGTDAMFFALIRREI